MSELHERLQALYDATDGRARIASDPIWFVHRYSDPRDQEIAGLVASGLAYGRVSLFFPALHVLFDAMDARGGPHAFVTAYTPDHAAPFADLVYRFNRGHDFTLWFGGLKRVLQVHGSIDALFAGSAPLKARLIHAVEVLRAAVVAEARAQGIDAASVADLSGGVRYLLPSPSTGSACKRWNLYLRWMVRPPIEGVDLGIWRCVQPHELIMPVDVHTGRVARFVGLTTRNDTTWRTAEAITKSLAAFDPADPIRFDFALCHLGMSNACLGHRDDDVCRTCPLDPICLAPKRAPKASKRKVKPAR